MAAKKKTEIDPQQMSDEEIRLRLELLARARGSSTAVEPIQAPRVAEGAGAYLVQVRATSGKSRGPRVEPSPKWDGVKKKCPHCTKTKLVNPDFGVVIRRGIEGPASWCKACRAATNYRALPRKNKVGGK